MTEMNADGPVRLWVDHADDTQRVTFTLDFGSHYDAMMFFDALQEQGKRGMINIHMHNLDKVKINGK